ncbi:acetolactate decarboxylase [Marivirga sp. S37H4]|uniref:Alpha-acetolactate decarboxylase n=2 Tax=Marivirga aurantiaca TaxID=2802615 RepID=A0A935C9U8_9BACT|nr:acetolactate decarboxylase [Marivirga aurantiaca]
MAISCGPDSKKETSGTEVQIVGAMKNVMWKGELAGTIQLDTIASKKGLYGLGPVEYLTGELLIIDGQSYVSTVLSDSTMEVKETYDIKAPFFVYANVEHWKEYNLPDSIQNLHQLEQFIDYQSKTNIRPFAFKLKGRIKEAKIHIQNLPKGTKVSSPEEAHQGQTNYLLQNEEVEIVGFFSTEHKGVFTHHDSFLHMHLITTNRSQMGHLDEVIFGDKKMKLYLPER